MKEVFKEHYVVKFSIYEPDDWYNQEQFIVHTFHSEKDAIRFYKKLLKWSTSIRLSDKEREDYNDFLASYTILGSLLEVMKPIYVQTIRMESEIEVPD